MSIKILLFLVFLVTTVACKQAQGWSVHFPEQRFGTFPLYVRKTNRIIGGFDINISAVPYQVSIQYLNIHYCGGSLLNKKWVLTAAHCTKNTPVSRLKVRLGSSRHASGGIVVQIKRSVEHPLYDDITVDYDFSLLELATELTFSDVVQPVALPEQNELVEAGTMAIVSGWGDTRNVNETSAVLRATNVAVVSQKDCKKVYYKVNITDRMLCAAYQQGGKNACQNESGGPLVADGKLVGVISWSFGCVQTALPGVYGRVASIREWVREHSRV